MLDKVPFTRLKYLADWSALTKRMGFSERRYSMYHITPPKSAERHGSKRAKIATYFPKYAHYLYKNSRLSYLEPSPYIKTYDKPSYMFAIQDSFSRFVVHACLKQQSSSNFKNLPSRFDFEDCFRESFHTFGRPFELMVDCFVLMRYPEFLEENCTIVTGTKHPAFSASRTILPKRSE
jgi:hypothetical protein